MKNREAQLGYPPQYTGVGESGTFPFLPQIPMGVQGADGQIGIDFLQGLDDRKAEGVFTAQGYDQLPILMKGLNPLPDIPNHALRPPLICRDVAQGETSVPTERFPGKFLIPQLHLLTGLKDGLRTKAGPGLKAGGGIIGDGLNKNVSGGRIEAGGI